jgi:hypothetical protein
LILFEQVKKWHKKNYTWLKKSVHIFSSILFCYQQF